MARPVGPDWEKVCYETRPTKQWLKPSDALVIKMLESWNRKRYGAHQTVDVNYGGVLRLEQPEERTAVIENRPEVEDEDTDAAEEGGHHLALARPANTSEEMDKWAEQGEFAPAPVGNPKGERTELRADVEALRMQAAELKRLGPVHKRPEGKVEVFKPDDEPRKEPEKPEPIPQTLADHPTSVLLWTSSHPRVGRRPTVAAMWGPAARVSVAVPIPSETGGTKGSE